MANGLSIPKLLSGLNLPQSALDSNHGRVEFEDAWRIINANQNFIEEETHLMSDRPLKRGTTRFVLSNLSHCKDLHEGLHSLADTYNVAHGGNFNFVKKRSHMLSFIVDDRNFHYRVKPSELAIELALINIHCALSILVGKVLTLSRIATKRPVIHQPNHHLQLFDCPVLWNHSHFELSYEAHQQELAFSSQQHLDTTNLYSHFLALRKDQSDADQDNSFSLAVVHKIKQDIRNQEDVAYSLGMSVATLRRKLKQEHTSFRAELEKVNRELATNFLLEEIPPADVAEKLNYCDVRSFKRAFMRWHGVSPAAFLKQKKSSS